MVRLVESKRWNVERPEHLTTIPDQHTTATTDAIEESATPYAGLQPDKTADEIEIDAATGARRLKITRDDLTRYGYSDHCPECNLHRADKHAHARCTQLRGVPAKDLSEHARRQRANDQEYRCRKSKQKDGAWYCSTGFSFFWIGFIIFFGITGPTT